MRKLAGLMALVSLTTLCFGSALAAHRTTEQSIPTSMSMRHCNQMMLETLGSADKQYDHRFIDSMIMHHQGAIDMAKNALSNSKRPEIRQTAEKIINDQSKEIEQLKTWRKQWYGE